MENYIVYLNPNSNLFNYTKRYIDSKHMKYIIINRKEELHNIFYKNIKDGFSNFIICGGDGFVNNFVNVFMKLHPKKRSKIKIGIIPCGKANDLARFLDIETDIKLAFQQIYQERTRKIDLINVNKQYFITGGGLGLSVETVSDVNLFLAKNNMKQFSKKLKDLIYLVFVIKKIFFGYKGIEGVKIDNRYVNTKNLMLIAIQNQPFIGKRFRLAPDADNSDGQFEVCVIEKPNNILSNLIMIYKIIKGKHLKSKKVFQIKEKKMSIILKNIQYYMADGELLCKAKKFNIEIIPQALTFYY